MKQQWKILEKIWKKKYENEIMNKKLHKLY